MKNYRSKSRKAMPKYKYTNEFELQASPKVLFPYISTPIGLEQWFVGEVKGLENKNLNFVWDNTDHFAKISIIRNNKQIKFEFLDNDNGSSINNTNEDPNSLEFRLDSNELTNSTFLKVIDYSEMNSEEDLNALWKGLMNQLREIVGG